MICQILKYSLAVKVEMPFSLQLLLNSQNISVFSSFLLHSLHSLVKVYPQRWIKGMRVLVSRLMAVTYKKSTEHIQNVGCRWRYPLHICPKFQLPPKTMKTMLNLDQKLRARQPYFRAIELHLGCNGLRATAQRGDITCYKTSYFWALCQTLALTLLLHQSTFQLTALFHTSPFTVSFQGNYGASNIWLISFSF